ncbi:telomere repeats-binding bouquet formation protein 2 isoform X1 [Takifugu rubripes]|uniref:Telomere repeat binding bouquet formation protein 2 n=1 Tax=Takifugu rubripes TaxID=31033 RepID=A0A674NIB4_TAKRU|nr:telomere repeats-binding bouquet formation protein 2 isoform X1 [Takifugu rubripes]XP_056881028.1 telomere repeats-binding bouquet formation protein 2 isoform X1 [Takifugu flavidus]|eukprot:XP_011608470.1 PREDICTED: uncharacterized protein C15orf43 homolog isoform X1 [Takifugu rubripes]
MFRNKTAWFSSSVPPACQHFWISEGGSVARWRKADYLFSEDATCPDTLRIYESRDYLWNQVVVFHSLFLSTCERRRSVRSVYIGHYVLPPASIQDEVREVVGRLIWESFDEQPETESWSMQTDDGPVEGSSRSDSSSSDAHSQGSEDSLGSSLNDSPDRDTCTGYVSMDNLPKYSGDLCDYVPARLRCFSCKAPCCPLDTF